MKETKVFLEDKDLHLTSDAISLFIILLKVQPDSLIEIANNILPEALRLVSSPFLQGATLQSLQSFFACIADCGASGTDFNMLLNALLQTTHQDKSQHVGIAKCIASLCCDGKPDMIPYTINRLITMIQSSREPLGLF